MRRPIRLAAGAALAGAVGLSPLAGVAVAHATSLPQVMTCTGKPATKPTSYVLACADDGSSFTSIKWTSWTATGASGTATFTENLCEPSCVAGKIAHYPATVNLSLPKSTSVGLLFSSVKYTYSVTTSQTLPLTAIGSGAGGA